jgi:hypothetical protein
MIGNIIWSEERPDVLFKSRARCRRSRPRALPRTTASRRSRPYDRRNCQSLFCVVIAQAGGGPKHGPGLVAISRCLTSERSSVRKLLCARPTRTQNNPTSEERSTAELTEALGGFATERKWEPYHTPKNLVISLTCHPQQRSTRPGGPTVEALMLMRPHGSMRDSTPHLTLSRVGSASREEATKAGASAAPRGHEGCHPWRRRDQDRRGTL